MEDIMFNFLLGIFDAFKGVYDFLTTPFFNGYTPLNFISTAGLVALLTILVASLFNPLG